MPTERRSGDRRRSPVTVVLVDDEPLILSALGQLLSDAGIELVGEARDGPAAIDLVLDVRPDVALMDIKLPGMSGVQVIEQLGLQAPATKVLVLTRTEQNRVVEAIVAGASGYILKSSPPKAIISAIQATAAGEAVLSSEIAGKLLERLRELDFPVAANGQTASSAIRATLTARELEIFALLASGESNHQIGRRLSLSPNTVSNHVKSILSKLHLHNRIQAAVQAVRAGIS